MKFPLTCIFSMILGVNMMQPVIASQHAEDASNNTMALFDFKNPNDLIDWRIINDGVMGGLSQGEITMTGDHTAVFQGNLSLSNNGGFSSTRTAPRLYNLLNYKGIVVHLKGDGKQYQLRLRTDDGFDGISYRYNFSTKRDEWITIFAAFRDFVPVFRGRVMKDAEPLAPDKIKQVGFLISDMQAGPFRLEVDWIKAYKKDSDPHVF